MTHLRLFPFILFIIVLSFFAYTATILASPAVGIIALILFATSQVTENFALQIRGYGFSWLPIVASLLALPLYIQQGEKKWGFLFILSSAASIAIIPSNLIVSLALVLWGYCLIFPNNNFNTNEKLLKALCLLMGPLLGIASYAFIWRHVIRVSHKKWSSWTYFEIAQHWLWSTISNFVVLMPFVVLGIIVLIIASLSNRSLSIQSPRNHLFLFSSIVFSFLFWMILSPNPPFPRTFVPILPVWYFIIAVFFVTALEFFTKKHKSIAQKGFIPFALLFFCISFFLRQPCTRIPPSDKYSVDLCWQYFHTDDYKPFQTVLLLSKMVRNNQVPIVTDHEGNYALGFIIKNNNIRHLKLIPYRQWKNMKSRNVLYPPIIVTNNKSNLLTILEKLGLPDRNYQQVANSGYFKIFKHISGAY